MTFDTLLGLLQNSRLALAAGSIPADAIVENLSLNLNYNGRDYRVWDNGKFVTEGDSEIWVADETITVKTEEEVIYGNT